MFIHLHTHSHYSLLDGLGTPDQLIAEAKKQGATALALTDHGNMYGAIEFYQKCKKADIKPIIGVEAYISLSSLTEKNVREKPYHLILLAENNEGYKNLLKLTTIAHLEGFYYKPRIDWATLKKYSKGLIASTACLGGPLARHIRAGQNIKVEENIKILLDIFGHDNLFLEMQNLNNDAQKIVNEEYKKLSKQHNIPLIITNDVHYVKAEDDNAQDVLLCIQTKQKQKDENRMNYLGEDYSMIEESKTLELFGPEAQEAIDNTAKIAERCNVAIELGVIQLPDYELPDNINADQELHRLCIEGVAKRYNFEAKDIPQHIQERLDYELGIITKTGYATYFLIVQDFVNWAKDQKIIVGPGRGSAAGSLVSYLINVTNIDPLKYDLIFERFLNPERVSMPDIDLDFADTRRDEVIRYVENKYGKDHVAQIITFGTMAARAAIRDVGRVLGYSYGLCDQLAKMIPMFTSLKEALSNVDELKKIYEEDPESQRLLDMAQKLEGLARHSSTHACAVLITKEPLSNYTPLQYASGDDKTIISQYSMNPVEALGLLKMDFLGLKNLTILEQTIKIVEATKDVKIDLDDLPLDDKKTFSLLQAGNTTGVFQLESGGMKRYLKQLKPTELEDIIAMVSLYRPGPMEFIPDFIAGKHGHKKVRYLHPKLEPILKNTYGIAIYQEQIMRIARDLAGFSYGQADVLRKAVGKKIKKLLDEQEEKIVSGMVDNGIDKKTANKIWEFIVPFARYGFNRSHAACYAMIAYQTAYLKSNFPEAFMAALLTADQDNTDRVTIEIKECHKMGIDVLPPDVNESFSNFAVVENSDKTKMSKIRFGLNAIKNVGHNIAKVIIKERKANGKYKSVEDLLTRIKDKDLNKKSLESLVKAGALDSLISRGQALGNIVTLLEFNKKIQNEHKSGQNNLFADLPMASSTLSLKLDEFEDTAIETRLSWEKELMGLYISDHPFKSYIKILKKHVTTLDKIKSKEGQSVKVSGIVTNVHKIITHKGQAMLFVVIEDSTASTEIIVFPKTLDLTFQLWQDENKVIVEGKVSDKDGQAKILVERAELITEEYLNGLNARNLADDKLWLSLPQGFDKEKMNDLKAILDTSPGLSPVYLQINNGKVRKIKIDVKVLPDKQLKEKIIEFLGPDSWELKKD
ncbi:MAG: DNA polymerase III subunit alpha [Candidatus Komeilibacteria bacterium]|nr:DNA polymerase III subunit alpha [Candidatus Komeilibacteria bacterium]